jgi:hypothetical protein
MTRFLLLLDCCDFVDLGRSLMRGQVCHLQLLVVLASEVTLESDSRGTRDHTLLSETRDFPLHRLILLAWLMWRHSTPPPRGISNIHFFTL